MIYAHMRRDRFKYFGIEKGLKISFFLAMPLAGLIVHLNNRRWYRDDAFFVAGCGYW